MGPLKGPMSNVVQSFPDSFRKTLPKQLRDVMSVVENHMALDSRSTIENQTKISGEPIKQIFWQASIGKLL